MLVRIEKISLHAQLAIDNKMKECIPGNPKYDDLLALKNAYIQLDELIKTAKKQHATIGSYILSRQLSHHTQELNATQLLENFLKVLDYPVTTTFMEPNVNSTSVPK
jgi:hypothetical protein